MFINTLASLTIKLTIVLLMFLPATGNCQPGSENKIADLLKHAETYYWLGMAEKGNLQAFEDGLKLLDQAYVILETANFEDSVKNYYQINIENLRRDLDKQIESAHLIFFSNFPLARFFQGVLFTDTEAYYTYELIEEPDVAAVIDGSENLAERIVNFEEIDVQYDVLFTSTPKNTLLENKCKFIFNKYSKFYIYNDIGLENILSKEEIDSLSNNIISTSILKKISSKLLKQLFLIINVREIDSFDGKYFYQVEGRIYSPDQQEPVHSFYVMSFCRDIRSSFLPILFFNIILLFTAIIIFLFLSRKKFNNSAKGGIVILPVILFLIGRILPIAIIPLVSSFMPKPEELASLSFWWPAALLLFLTVVPFIVIKNLSVQIKKIFPFFNLEGKLGQVFLVTNLGVCAFLIEPIILYYNSGAYPIIISMVLSTSALSYLIGRGLDKIDRFPLYVSIISMLLVLLLGFALMYKNTSFLFEFASVSLVFMFIVLIINREKEDSKEENIEIGKKNNLEGPSSVDEVIQMAEDPPYYYENENFQMIVTKTKEMLFKDYLWMGLIGHAGIGKSATAEALISQLAKEITKQELKVTVLRGDCPERENKDSQVIPYAPFQQALRKYFNINSYTIPEEHVEFIDSALDGIFESFVPFSGLLFPKNENQSRDAVSKEAMFDSIKMTLTKLAEKSYLIIYIDDVHWIDDASLELLKYLRKELIHINGQILFILTSREEEIISSIDKIELKFFLKSLSYENRFKILTETFNFTDRAATKVLENIGIGDKAYGDLFWLYHIIGQLARLNAIKKVNNNFEFTEEYKSRDKFPIPDEYRNSIRSVLSQYPEFEDTLTLAGCIGMNFRVSIISECLEISRLKCLQILDAISDNTGFIMDVTDNDDYYTFHSSFVLEVLRDELKITDEGPSSKKVPQIIREYHYRIANTLLKLNSNSPSEIYSIAKHFYAAGISSASEAIKYSLIAAENAVSVFQFDIAQEYLRMAKECSELTYRNKDYELEFILLECQIAHISGTKQIEIAQKCIEYYNQNDDLDKKALIIFARTTYDARMFEENIRLSEALINDTKNYINQAEGYHFTALSLPLEQKIEREGYLRKAIEISERVKSDSAEQEVLYARICNSLAEELSKHDKKDTNIESEIVRLFDRSIEIKQKDEIRDLPGLARSYGGLGRYYFFKTPPDLINAKKYFIEDLTISQKICDLAGQTQMYSFLAACALAENNIDEARKYYSKSFELSQKISDKIFAMIGLLECGFNAENRDEIDKLGEELLIILSKNQIPVFCKKPLTDIIDKIINKFELKIFKELIKSIPSKI